MALVEKRQLRAAVIAFPGSNGDRDLTEALQQAGFEVRVLSSDANIPTDYELIALPGGFSYGDYWRAGVLARTAPAVRNLPSHIARGALVIGICNGFQILVEAGILPGALASNEPPGFIHDWVDISIDASARTSPWFAHVAVDTLRLPIAHGEGNFRPAPNTPARIAVRYQRPFNGAFDAAAGLLDASGRVLGLMPHPERAHAALQGSADGAMIFASAHRYLQEAQA